MKTWEEHLVLFYKTLKPPVKLPDQIEWLFPQKDPHVINIVVQFLRQYYNDSNPRTLLLGINPGRFGAGVTGVNFTAPKQLREVCAIDHSFKDQSEISAEFIYAMIDKYGGAKKFYSDFFIGAVSPLGFIRNGKNLNYYDDKELLKTVEPFIIKSLKRLVDAPVDRNICFCVGGEKNYKYLSGINEEYKWFEKIVALPHPRFIMQYRRKQKHQFIQQYLEAIKK